MAPVFDMCFIDGNRNRNALISFCADLALDVWLAKILLILVEQDIPCFTSPSAPFKGLAQRPIDSRHQV